MADNNGAANLAWFLTGITLGAVATLLFAPQTSAETREYLREKAAVGKEKLERSGKDALERGRELYDRGKELADEAVQSLEKDRKTVKRAPGADEATEVASG
jgi:gas vesicle protein